MLTKLWLLSLLFILQAPFIHSFFAQRRIANWRSEIIESYAKKSLEASLLQKNPSPSHWISDSFPQVQLSNKDSFVTDYYVGLLNTLPVYGKWKNPSSSSQFGFFREQTGITYTEIIEEDYSNPKKLYFTLDILDGGYLATNAVTFVFNEISVTKFSFDQASSTLTGKNIELASYFFASNEDRASQRSCLVDISFAFIDMSNKTPLKPNTSNKNFAIQYNIRSANCKLSASSTLMDTTRIPAQEMILYIAVMSLAALVGIFSAEKLIKDFPDNMSQLEKLSVWSLCLTNAWDFFLFVFHAAFFIAFSSWLAVVTIFYFALSALCETKLTYAIFFSSHSDARVSLAIQRKFLATYYVLMMAFNLSYIYWSYNTAIIWTLLTSSFYLVPQIMHVNQRGRNYRFNYWQVFGFMLSRVSFVVYMTLYEDNIFGNIINPKFTYTYLTIIFVQLGILFVQKWKPRFCYTPAIYNYFVTITTDKEKEELCAICMESLGTTVTDDESRLTKPLLGKSAGVTVMQTPCNHRFHESCLKAWVKSKLVCPFDRTDLPPLNNEDIE